MKIKNHRGELTTLTYKGHILNRCGVSWRVYTNLVEVSPGTNARLPDQWETSLAAAKRWVDMTERRAMIVDAVLKR